MRDAVRRSFAVFTDPIEACLGYLYLDVRGLVTTGRGDLVDPMGAALALPFLNPDGTPATRDAIAAAWRTVKGRQDLASAGGGHFAPLTTIRLSQKGIDDLTFGKLAQVDAELAKRFAGYAAWPADAQMGVLSMGWAMGAAFRFPIFESDVARLDFDAAAVSCHISERGNAGVAVRNRANVVCFTNAARVLENTAAYCADTLYWPNALHGESFAAT